MTILVDAVVYYKIYDPVISITNIVNVSVGTRLLAQTQLRNVMGSHSLADAMTGREMMAKQLKVVYDSPNAFIIFLNIFPCLISYTWIVQLILGA